MATLPLDQALALYTRAQSDAERLAALLVITRAAPAQTAEQRLLLRQALGYAFVGRLLRSPPAAPAAAEPDAGASVSSMYQHVALSLLALYAVDGQAVAEPQFLQLVPAAVAAVQAVVTDVAAQRLSASAAPAAAKDAAQPATEANATTGPDTDAAAESVGQLNVKTAVAAQTDSGAGNDGGTPGSRPATATTTVLDDSLSLLVAVAQVPDGRSQLLSQPVCRILVSAAKLERLTEQQAHWLLQLSLLLLTPTLAADPHCSLTQVQQICETVAFLVENRRDDSKLQACRTLVALGQQLASPAYEHCQAKLAEHKGWQQAAAKGIFDLLQTKLNQELRILMLDTAASCCLLTRCSWVLSSSQQDSNLAHKRLLLLTRLATVELRMQMEEPSPDHAVQHRSLIASCFVIIESVLHHLVMATDEDALPVDWTALYASLKAAMESVLMFLEAVREAQWTAADCTPAREELLTGCARLLGIWAAEETEVLQREVYIGIQTILAVIRQPVTVLDILLPGLLQLVSIGEVETVMLSTPSPCFAALSEYVAAISERPDQLSSAAAYQCALVLLHLHSAAAAQLMRHPDFARLHQNLLAVAEKQLVAQHAPLAHLAFSLLLLRCAVEEKSVQQSPAELGQILGAAGLIVDLISAPRRLSRSWEADAQESLDEFSAEVLDLVTLLVEQRPAVQKILDEAAQGPGPSAADNKVCGPRHFLAALQRAWRKGPDNAAMAGIGPLIRILAEKVASTQRLFAV